MGQGRFITIEGGEGAGKSTQIRALSQKLQSLDISTKCTREPGGSTGAEEIRRLFVEGVAGRWDATSEALLVLAARRDHLVKTVWPALADGTWVLCDRFIDSTYAYQGYGHGLPLESLDQLHAFTLGAFRPDLTILIDLPVETGLERAHGRQDRENRFESLERDFHERVRHGFLERVKQDRARFLTLDGTRPLEQVTDQMIQSVLSRFELSVEE
ncbi:MAG: dTMP kinase [Pseudomonadota bacterium]